ncbi:MAG: ABC transporter ATP-binding protein [Candidatus Thioglobus sp.]|nr:MAG: ABC transporter ATP-binding protein [Candidatus Thioglobus sp.]
MNFISQLLDLLDAKQRKNFLVLQVVVIIMSLLEIITLLLIWQLITAVTNTEALQIQTILQPINQLFSAEKPQDVINLLAGLSIIAIIVNNIVAILVNKYTIIFANTLSASFVKNLYHYYLNQSWIYHTKHNSSHLITKIQSESYRLSRSVIMPIISINVRLILSLFLLVTLVNINFMITLWLILIFSICYGFIYYLVYRRLGINGQKISFYNKKRFHLAHLGLDSIRDILLFNKQSYFTKRFDNAVDNSHNSVIANDHLAQMPRYIIELLILITLPIVILYFSNNDLFVQAIPLLSIYAIATLKLLPSFGRIYLNISTIRSNIAAFYSVKDDLLAAKNMGVLCQDNKIEFNQSIEFKQINFSYPNAVKPALIDINLSINKNKTIAIIGKSGSGKSTLVDVLAGLLPPNSGQLLVDGQVISQQNLGGWKQNIGYVSQHIFLGDMSIEDNIAFGVETQNIDANKLEQCIEFAQLTQFIGQLSHGVNTIIGERGVKLSGGQRQRIGIARALYHNAQIIIFDEATNALDGITERAIIETMDYFSQQKTIILIAHRLNTIKHCDVIYLMDKGKIVDFGSYQHLQENNDYIKTLNDI